MARKCPLFDMCILRMRYEVTPSGSVCLKKHCRGDYRKCGKYLLDKDNRMVPGKKPGRK